ncbi:MAG: hypothetical protein PUI65_03665 [Prevotella sp.]|nr:hypothetical protein [Prevotella sp.]
MKYQYNFSFLSQWLEANPEIPKGEILQAIGAKSNNRFKAWVRCEGPMPVLSMLRLCNAYQIPLSAFFRDADAGTDGAVVPGMPMPDDILEPTQGYASSTDERQHGERSMLNPLDVQIAPSVVPGVVAKLCKEDDIQEQPATVDNISDANLAAIIKMENEHMAQQRRLLDIITEQQKQIADLTHMLDDAKRNDNTNMGINDGYMVADRPTRD